MTGLRAVWRRLFPPSDGSICEQLNPQRCDRHVAFDGPCRCLDLPHHGGLHECGQGARWASYVRSGT